MLMLNIDAKLLILFLCRPHTIQLTDNKYRTARIIVEPSEYSEGARIHIQTWRASSTRFGSTAKTQSVYMGMSRIKEMYYVKDLIAKAIVMKTPLSERLGANFYIKIDHKFPGIALRYFNMHKASGQYVLPVTSGLHVGVNLTFAEWSQLTATLFPFLQKNYNLDIFETCRQMCELADNQMVVLKCGECSPDSVYLSE